MAKTDEEAKSAREARREANRAEAARVRALMAPSLAPPAPVPCPDPMAPGAAMLLYAAVYRRMWNRVHGPMTVQDEIGALNATRLGAAVGKTPEPAKQFDVDMDSMLGGAPKRGDEEPPE